MQRICTGSERVYFDTERGDHQHFHAEAENLVIDVPKGNIAVDRLPVPPSGYEITRVDVVIHIRATDLAAGHCETRDQCLKLQNTRPS